MGSWLQCPCGARIQTNAFSGGGVSWLVREDDYDAVEDPVDREKMEKLVVRGGVPVFRCLICGRLAVQWNPKAPAVFYAPSEDPAGSRDAARTGNQPPG